MASQSYTFLTGGTGFVGSAVTRLLLKEGHRIRALARKGSDRRNLDGLDIEIIEGDLTEPSSYSKALAGCEALFHVAADYRIWVPDADAMHRVNVIGTNALMMAALDTNVKRIVYTSSVATLGNAYGKPANEDTPSSYTQMVGAYKRSKFLAEQEVQRLIRHHDLPAVIVNPSTPIGPRDIKPTPTGRIIVDAAKGKIPAYIDTGLNIVHVDDVAMGHWLAYQHGKVGERYVLGGENLGLGTILTIIAGMAGRAAPKVILPRLPLFPVAWALEAMARVHGKEPFVTADALRMAKKKMFFSSSKAEQELGFKARPARAAIQDAVTWFKEQRYI